MTLPRIFVHIPSYRDHECQWTVKDLFEKAEHPERVFVGICWQTFAPEDQACFVVETRPQQVRTLCFDIHEARGLGWARQHAASLWRGEEYSLQIDSHMRFVQDWDTQMLDMLAQCDSADPVLTIYPPAYLPPNELFDDGTPKVQCIRSFRPGWMLEFDVQPVPAGIAAERPHPTASLAGGFVFGSSRILRDVPFDDQIYFNGEEPSLAVRLFTHGFDLFSPHRTLVYHYYKRIESKRHWNDDAVKAGRLTQITLQRMAALCQPATCPPDKVAALGRYGLGTRRSLAQYEAFSGVNFAGWTLAAFAKVYPFVRSPVQAGSITPMTDLVPAEGIALFILDDEGLLFSAAKGEFYKLNATSLRVWCALEEGLDWSQISLQLAGWRDIPHQAASEELSNLAAHWLGLGALRHAAETAAAVVLPPVPRPWPATELAPSFDPRHVQFRDVYYRLLDVVVRVRYGDAPLFDRVHPVLAHLAETGNPDTAQTVTLARIHQYVYVYANKALVYLGESVDGVAPLVKFAVLDLAVRQQKHILHLHAAAVQANGRLVLLPAPSGGGKTSLTARLLLAGCTYFTDEVVLLGRDDGQVLPCPVSLCVKAGGLDLLEGLGLPVRQLPEHERQDGMRVRYLPPPPLALPPTGRSAKPALLVFPTYVPGAPLKIRRLTRVDAFERMLAECVGVPRPLTLPEAAVLMEVMEGMDCFEMAGGDLDETSEAVLALVNAPGCAQPSGRIGS
ncbi:MAG: hypothetical protein JWP29_3805 [Rhodoferax sp.]|nr:hypothetical protein [Rhodoferax sp.]